MKKKILMFLCAICLIVPVIFCLSACNDNDEGMYNIKYIIDGEVVATSVEGKDVFELKTGESVGVDLIGWFLDSEFNVPFIPSRDLTTEKPMYLYGKVQ